MPTAEHEGLAVGEAQRGRALMAFVLAGAVLAAGKHIPLPGLDPSMVAGYVESSPGAAARLSVLALGLQPLLSVLLLFETAKLVLPGFAVWGGATPLRRRSMRTAIAAATLLLAASQGAGIHHALVWSGLATDDRLSALAVVASLVAGVAVLVVVAERVRLPDLAQGGFWLVLSLPWCAGLVAGLWDMIDFARLGMVKTPEIGLLLGAVAAAVAATLFCAGALRRGVSAGGGDPCRWSPILVWPPLLAGSLAGLAAGAAFEVLPPGFAPTLGSFALLWSLAFTLTLPPVVFLYARSIGRTFPEGADWPGKIGVLTIVAAVQVLICAGLMLTTDLVPVPLPSGSALIALAVVSWSIGQAVGIDTEEDGRTDGLPPERSDALERGG